MKILFVQTNAFSNNASGVPRVTYNLGRYFKQQGLDVAYFSFKTEGHIEVEYGELYHAKESNGVSNKNNLTALKNCIKYFQPDKVINQMPYMPSLRKVLAQQSAAYHFKLIGCIHNSLFPFKNNVKAIMKRNLPMPFNYVMSTNLMSKIPLLYHNIKQRVELTNMIDVHDKLLLFTHGNYEELKYFLKPGDFEDQKIGIMTNPISDIQKEVPKKEKIILHLGRLNIPQKRSDLLLDFWEKAYQDLPDWQFKVVGDGPYYDTLVADLQKRQLPRIELLGFQKAEPYYKEASLYMMPSAYEGLPNTIIEANSYGCPVLAFNSYAALKWIVEHNKNALLVKPYDTNKMAQICVDVAKNAQKLESMQKSALKNAERFSIQKIGKQWLELFKKLE